MSLAFEIRGACEPSEMVKVAVEIMRRGTIAEKLAALNWLSTNGYQRPAERLEVLTAEVPQIEAQRVLARLSVDAHREWLAAIEAEQEIGSDVEPITAPGRELAEGDTHDDTD